MSESIKKSVRERDGWKCVDCSMTWNESLDKWNSGLQVHRLVPLSAYSLQGCVTVCKKCHGLRHREINKRWRENPSEKETLVCGTRTVAIRIYCGRSLKRRAEEAAREAGIPVSEYVAKRLAESLGEPSLGIIPRGDPGRPRKKV